MALVVTCLLTGLMLYAFAWLLLRLLLLWKQRQFPLDPLPDSIQRKCTFVSVPATSDNLAAVVFGRKFHRYHLVYIAHKRGPNVPLLIFLHGLGGQINQFQEQLSHFSSTANVLAVDLFGHGKSQWSMSSAPYSLDSMAADLAQVIQLYACGVNVLIGHSMGTGLCALLYPILCDRFQIPVQAIVFLGARYHMHKQLQYIGYLPSLVVEYLRWKDRRGDLESESVKRFMHPRASMEMKRKQLASNLRSTTHTILRIMCTSNSYPSREDWRQIRCPCLILVGDEDRVNPVTDSKSIHERLSSFAQPPTAVPNSGHNFMMENPGLVNAFIGKFLVEDVGLKVLDPAYQLLEMSSPGHKWNLKNYEKWKRTEAICKNVVRGTMLRGMKVMREGDDEHSPCLLRQRYPEVGLVVDISHDAPPYKTDQVHYVKLATTSKVPPSREEVQQFIRAIKSFWKQSPGKQVAVHCHYGYNRTGFLICSYLIEELKIPAATAVQAWAEARPPGIKHSHFIDELYLRYASAITARVVNINNEI